MNIQNSSKINLILREWPRGTVGVNSWLARHGVSRSLAKVYVRTSWLIHVGRGAYARADTSLDWTGGLYTLQEQLRMEVHAGGKTAFQLHGYAHFIPVRGHGITHLFGDPNQKLPSWFKGYSWKSKVRHHMTHLISYPCQQSLTKKDMGEYSITISSLERSMFEYLYLVPREESFEEGRFLMEGLVSLRPALIQELLEKCNSIKVKRLFMVLAEEFNHAWLKKLDVSKINFGKGKRVIVRGGKLHPKYFVTIPRVTDSA